MGRDRKRRSNGSSDVREAKRMRRVRKRRSDGRSAKRRRKHLYLAVDYWTCGPCFHKVDLTSNSDSDGAKEQLPASFISLNPQHDYFCYVMAALGTNIIAIPLTDSHGFIGKETTVVDMRSQCLCLGPRPVLEVVNPTFIPTDDRLFVLSSNSFQVLTLALVEEAAGTCSNGLWCELPMHPFKDMCITSSAVHPDGRIFISAKNIATSFLATYTFDMTSGWKKLGDWVLPFTDHAHFYRRMNAWVGIHEYLNFKCICACDVGPLEFDGSGWKCPSWNFLEEDMFSLECDERHAGANLVFNGKRFCLVECVSSIEGYVNLFRLTKFSLMYNKDGDLTTGDSVRHRCYEVPNNAIGYSLVEPLAFWL